MKSNILTHLSPAHPWGQLISCYETLPSTNNEARKLAAQGAAEGTVLIADHQTAGRGRLGRSFCSPAAAGIYMSVILRPYCPPAELMHLTCAVGVAVCDAVEEVLEVRPGLKWINDLVWEGKKLGGILTELAIDPKTGFVESAIIGIGLNCSESPGDFPPPLDEIACSLSMVTGKSVDRWHVAAGIIEKLYEMHSKLFRRAELMDRYRRSCVTLGKEVLVIRGDVRRPGKALSIGDDGSLLVAYEDGQTEPVNSGEVSIRGMFGYA
jgi:BirA family biotin operon repressor/biotin-[acetyl-CoA-carboxylase] ligase